MTTRHDLALLRLAALRLIGPGLESPVAAVRWLLAAQAQDLPGALTSVALRTRAAGRAAVEAALDRGEIVRSWPMRGTLHFVAAEDLCWLTGLAAGRAARGQRARQAQLGLDDATLDRAQEVAAGALAGGKRLTRAELYAVWTGAGVATDGQRGVHLIYHLAQAGIVCLGPLDGGEQRLVLADEWVRAPRRLAREEALAELALRYFRGHGPATVADLARWTRLPLRDVRAGLVAVRDRLERLVVDDTEYFLDPETPEVLAAHRERARGVLLLPGFDEFLLGYADRGAALPAEHADRIAPGGNGVFRPTIVVDGQVVGTWRHAGRGTARTIQATPFTEFGEGVTEELTKVYAALP